MDSMVAPSSRGGRGDGSGAAVAVATGVVLLPLRSELAVWRGGMEQGDAGGEGYKKGKPGASAAAARLGAVRFCAVARVRRTRTSRGRGRGVEPEGRLDAGGTAAACAVCGLRGLLTSGIDCVLPPL